MDEISKSVITWAVGAVGTVALLVLSLHLRANKVSQRLGELRILLVGFEGAGGGLMQRISRLEGREETVDQRIDASRQLVVGQLQQSLAEVEERVLARIDVSDQRVQREIDELKDRRRP